MEPGTAETECLGQDVQRSEAYFNADDGLLALTWTTHLHWAFETLAVLFDCVGLHNNVAKMVSMAGQPCRAIGGHSVEDYGLWMRGEEQTYQD